MDIKKDCILYDAKFGRSSKGMCKGLKKLYCDVEDCVFYKSSGEYNADGKRKKQGSRFATPTSR